VTRQNLKNTLSRLNKKDKGQGMTEYIIIVALIAIAAIGVVTVFGQDIRHLFGASTAALSGDTSVQSKAKTGQKKADTKKTLKDFGKDNAGN
jgi:Flp pilus assembly pilin Flp